MPGVILILSSSPGRTALAVNGWDDAEERLRSYVQAGADVVFVDAFGARRTSRNIGAGSAIFPILFNNVPLLPIGLVNELGGRPS